MPKIHGHDSWYTFSCSNEYFFHWQWFSLITLETPTSLKSDLSRDINSVPEISCSRKAWQYMGKPMASNHWLTSLGDHWTAISTMQEDESPNFRLPPVTVEALVAIDEVEAEAPSAWLRSSLLPSKLMEGERERPNFGTRNQEFRRCPDSWNDGERNNSN